MDLLARREHGIAELSRKLQAKGLEAQLVEEAVSGLANDNLVSDQRFCEAMINSRYNNGHGPIKVRYELRNKGVPEQVIESVMEELSPDWQQALADLIKKKYPDRQSGTPAERAKKVRFLSSRGFPHDMIFRVMQDVGFDQEQGVSGGI